MEYWSNGVLEYWIILASYHHSIAPILQCLLIQDTASKLQIQQYLNEI